MEWIGLQVFSEVSCSPELFRLTLNCYSCLIILQGTSWISVMSPSTKKAAIILVVSDFLVSDFCWIPSVHVWAMKPKSALLIKHNWCSQIFNAGKRWEIRNKATKVRGRIGIACTASSSPSGVSLLLGEATLTECIQVGVMQGSFITAPPNAVSNYMFLEKNVEKHKIYHVSQFPDLQKYKQVFAWVLADVVEYNQPKVLPRKKGQIVWAKLSWDLLATLPQLCFHKEKPPGPCRTKDCQCRNAKESVWKFGKTSRGATKPKASLNVTQLALPWPGCSSSCCKMSRSLIVSPEAKNFDSLHRFLLQEYLPLAHRLFICNPLSLSTFNALKVAALVYTSVSLFRSFLGSRQQLAVHNE